MTKNNANVNYFMFSFPLDVPQKQVHGVARSVLSMKLEPLFLVPRTCLVIADTHTISWSHKYAISFPSDKAWLTCWQTSSLLWASLINSFESTTSCCGFTSVVVSLSRTTAATCRDNTSALTCFLPGQWMTSNSYSESFKIQRVSPAHWWFSTVISHFNAAWSVMTLNFRP